MQYSARVARDTNDAVALVGIPGAMSFLFKTQAGIDHRPVLLKIKPTSRPPSEGAALPPFPLQ